MFAGMVPAGKHGAKDMTYTWCELEEQLLEDMASIDIRIEKVQSYRREHLRAAPEISATGRSPELKDLLAYVQSRCAMERGPGSLCGPDLRGQRREVLSMGRA